MILVDFNNLAYRALFVSVGLTDRAPNPEKYGGMCNHILLSALISAREKFGNDYTENGPMVIAKDCPWTWRGKLYPEYKKTRKRSADIDWNAYWPFQADQFQSLKIFGFSTIEVDNVEADDIIAVLSKYEGKHLIVSQDKDFRQLVSKDVHLYKPMDDELVTTPMTRKEFDFHVLLGDKVDNIPSIRGNTTYSKDFLKFCEENKVEVPEIFGLDWGSLRDDPKYSKFFATFSTPFKPGDFGPKTCEKFYENFLENLQDPVFHKRFLENKQLIDLGMIPDDMVERIKSTPIPSEVMDRDAAMRFCHKWNLEKIKSSLGLAEDVFNSWLN